MFKFNIKYDITSDIFEVNETKLPTELEVKAEDFVHAKSIFIEENNVTIINEVHRSENEIVLYAIDTHGTMFQCYVTEIK